MITRCLVLDKRYNLYLELEKQLNDNHFDPKPFIAGDGTHNLAYDHIDTKDIPTGTTETNNPAWYLRPNAYNAWLCHRKIFQEAVSKNEDLFLLEDDACLTEDFKSLYDNTMDKLSNVSWDMLYLGWYSNGHLYDTEHDYIKRMVGGAGFHGVIIKIELLREMVNFNPLGPYDESIGKLHRLINAYAVYPCIVIQRSGFSYVENSYLHKPDRYKR